MKTVLVILILFVHSRASAGDYKFYFFGVDLDYLKERNFASVALGAVTSVAVHIAGHHAYAQINDIAVHQRGSKEYISGDTSESDKRGFALAGFAGQHLIGLLLTSFEATRHSDFTRGYVAVAALETLSYPLRHRNDGDFNTSERNGGNKNLEYGIFSLISLHNVFRVKWYHGAKVR